MIIIITETKLHITVMKIIKYRWLVIKMANNLVAFDSSPYMVASGPVKPLRQHGLIRQIHNKSTGKYINSKFLLALESSYLKIHVIYIY